jgi:hypothetical protein
MSSSKDLVWVFVIIILTLFDRRGESVAVEDISIVGG